MSTGSIGELGYDDDQPQSSFDDQTPFVNVSTPIVGAFTAPVIDCSRWHGVYIKANNLTLQSFVRCRWYYDIAASSLIGSDSVTLDPANPGNLYLSVTNRGPYILFDCTPSSLVAQWTPQLVAIFSNRTRSTPLGSVQANMTVHPFALAAGASATFNDIAYYGGEANLFINGGTQGITVTASFLTSSFSYIPFMQQTQAANTVGTYRIIWPAAATQIVVTNTSGAAACTGCLISLFSNLQSF